jgi:hypothetical protein
MKHGAKWCFAAGGIAAILLGIWLYFRADIDRWRKERDLELSMQQEAYEALKSLKPTTPTAEEIHLVNVVRESLKFADGTEKKVVIVKNFLPLMEGRKDLPAAVTCARNRRDANGLYTIFWSEQARYAIEFDWKNGTIKKCKKPENAQLSYTPSETPKQNKNDVLFNLIRDWDNKDDKNYYLYFTPSDRKKTLKLPNPWDVPVHIDPVYSIIGYKYGAAIISDRKFTGDAVSFAIFNVEKPAFCGEIKVPKQTFGTPLNIIDSGNECLLCVDDYLKWMICVDLADKK